MYLTNRTGGGCGFSYVFIYFPISKNVLLIRVRYVKLDSCIVQDERLTWWDAVSLDILIHQLPFMSHSCFTLMPPSVSCLCISVPGGPVSQSSICQHHPGGDRADEIGTWLLQDWKTTNDKWQSQNKPTWEAAEEKWAESLFHHPSASLLVLSLTSSSLFFCTSLPSTRFTPQTIWSLCKTDNEAVFATSGAISTLTLLYSTAHISMKPKPAVNMSSSLIPASALPNTHNDRCLLCSSASIQGISSVTKGILHL